MCGIAGIIARGRDPARLRDATQRMTDALAHRGPDDAGIESLALPGGIQVCLGHRRLSILDLSPNGHQPMGDARSGSWVVFNGEIYNHLELRRELPDTFRSTSDTETLLRGWVAKGPEWVRSLRGIFAFALLDAQRQELWLVRDHLGVKPLYVSQPEEDLWLFASEVRALLASGMVGKQLCTEGLNSYLAFGAVQAPWTLVAGIRSLMPGERWCFPLRPQPAKLLPRVSRYWSIAEHFPHQPRRWAPLAACPPVSPSHGQQAARGTRALTSGADWEQLKATWQSAVGSQMLSDVPVGVFLSGGIDSSAIVATLARQGHSPKTFSVVFTEHGFDESQHSERIARQYGTEHHAITVTPDQVLSGLDRTIAAYDQPSIDGINTYVISRAVRQSGIKVAISGLGGDEVFAGYPTFRRLPKLEKWARFLPKRLAALTAAVVSRGLESGRGARLGAILRGDASRLNIYRILRQLFAATSRGRLLPDGLSGSPDIAPELIAELSCQAQSVDAVNAVSLLELSLYMQNMLLRDTDQMSMAHGLEARVPLLDHRLVAALAGIPGPLKLSSAAHSNKWLLLELAGVSLPPEVVRRPKMGFVFPWDAWLRRELRGRTENVLMDAASVQRAGMGRDAVAKLWRQYLEKEAGWRSSDVLALVHLVEWVAANQLGPPVPSVEPQVAGPTG